MVYWHVVFGSLNFATIAMTPMFSFNAHLWFFILVWQIYCFICLMIYQYLFCFQFWLLPFYCYLHFPIMAIILLQKKFRYYVLVFHTWHWFWNLVHSCCICYVKFDFSLQNEPTNILSFFCVFLLSHLIFSNIMWSFFVLIVFLMSYFVISGVSKIL